jgi:DNA-binding MarR family transcriptional regulator
MKDTDTLVNESILNVFSGFKSALKKEYKDRALEISPMHFRSLQIIRHNTQATSQMVSEILNRDKSQIARLIGELTKQGFVKAEKDPKDKRNRLLTLTTEGEAVTKELALVEQSVIKRMTKGVAKQDLNQFVEVSKKLRENLSG